MTKQRESVLMVSMPGLNCCPGNGMHADRELAKRIPAISGVLRSLQPHIARYRDSLSHTDPIIHAM
jgi:hypothetical protein